MDSEFRTSLEAGIISRPDERPAHVMKLDGLPSNIEFLTFIRQDTSQRGLSQFRSLKSLSASRVNQDTIDEIAQLPELEVLSVKLLSAKSLEPLGENRKLKRLILQGGGKVADMRWTRRLSPTVEVLHLEDFFRATDIDPIGEMTQLRTLGLQGGMSKKLELESLAALRTLSNLQYLFLSSTRVADKSLVPLHGLSKLKHLRAGHYFPDKEFIALQKAVPDLDCDWFRMIEEYGSIRSGMAAFSARMAGRTT